MDDHLLPRVGSSRTEREEIHDDVFCIVHIFPFFALDGALRSSGRFSLQMLNVSAVAAFWSPLCTSANCQKGQ